MYKGTMKAELEKMSLFTWSASSGEKGAGTHQGEKEEGESEREETDSKDERCAKDD